MREGYTKTGKPYGIAKVEDYSGSAEFAFFTQALTGPELLRRAAQDPAFAVFCPAPRESLSALTPPACMPDALRQEVQSSLSAAEEAPRLTACAALHRLASRCEAQSAEAAEHCRTARRLWPRLGGCLGAMAAILLW